MLTPGIHAAYDAGVAALDGNAAAVRVAKGVAPQGCNRGQGALFATSAIAFLADKALGHEVFGAAAVIVRCADEAELALVLRGLEGQLTATLQIDAGDEAMAARVLPLLADRAGRVLANGWPTGVEVTHAMVHGGPYPATSDVRTTSVGTLALARFLRPICYQDLPANLLPPPLRPDNPWGIPRKVDDVWECSQ
jgi:NADP-dependent aldehyde dehydrogenase